MLRVVALLPFLASSLLIPLAPTQASQAASASGLQTSATVNGLKLSLILAKRVYPRDALIRVTVRITNVSTVLVWTWMGSPIRCGAEEESPRVEVLDDRGQVAYPAGLPPSTCHYGGYTPMSPRQSFTSHPFVILRGRYVVATAGMMVEATGAEFPVITPKLPVRLVSEPTPRVSLRVTDTNIYASIQPATPVHGSLWYVDLAQCPAVYLAPSYHPYWTKGKGRRLLSGHVPECSPPTEWHVLVGWLGHPVVTINYRE